MKPDRIDSLPPGWVSVQLRHLGQWSSGGTPSRKRPELFNGSIPWVKSGDLSDGDIAATDEMISELGLANSAAKMLPAGSILIALYGATIGKLGVLTFPAATNQACAACQVNNSLVEPTFVFLFLLSQREQLIAAGQGGAQPNLSNEIVRNWPMAVPPLAEQRRIVAKVEAVLARANAARQRLAKVPALLKRFRQSILAAVLCGDECSLGDVLVDLKYGTSKKCEQEKRGVPVLRIPNVSQGVVDQSDLKYAELDDKERKATELRPGDLLMIRSNGSVSLLGRSALVTEREKGFSYAGYLMRLRLDIKKIDPKYAYLALSGHACRDQIEMPARSTSGVNNINSDEVRNLRLPLPPLSKQHEIVRRVDALFALADKIEARVLAASARADKLIQSTLAKAFRGELVPTEHSLAEAGGRAHESAVDLLARITKTVDHKAEPTKRRRRTIKEMV